MYKCFELNWDILILSFLMVLSFKVEAEIDKHDLSMHAGFAYVAIQDNLASPLIYRNGGIPWGLDYYFQRQKLGFHSTAAFKKLTLLSKYKSTTTSSVDFWNIKGTISWHYAFFKIAKINTTFFYGPILENQVSVRAQTLDGAISEDWFISNYLSINLAFTTLTKLFTRHALRFQASGSVFAYIIGNKYYICLYNVKDLGHDLSFFPEFWRLQTTITYRFYVNNLISLYSSYTLSYLRYDHPDQIRIADDSFLAGIGFSFISMRKNSRRKN